MAIFVIETILMMNLRFLLLLFFSILLLKPNLEAQNIVVGAQRFNQYLPLLKDKSVGMVVNHTSMVIDGGEDKHLVDCLLEHNVGIKKIFAPEHGFRGTADAGEKVESGIDQQTGLPIISLYGSHKKPTEDDYKGLDVLIFDIQDVGARFYTYISTMHYIMEAAAEQDKEVIILDRPNPNGFYVDGPILDPDFTSFVGMHSIPIVHGCTVGELAQMINGEGWLLRHVKCQLTVIPCEGYDHNSVYELPHRPSPNLPNMTSVYLYPSLCLFEGTPISIGRGTEFPFQVYGHPELEDESISFTPRSTSGAKYPKLEGKLCNGKDLRNIDRSFFEKTRKLYLGWLINAHGQLKDDPEFFTPFFDKLAGTDNLARQLYYEESEMEIRASWEYGLNWYKGVRKKYLLYPDYE